MKNCVLLKVNVFCEQICSVHSNVVCVSDCSFELKLVLNFIADAMRKRTNMRNELNALKVGKAQYKNLLNVHVRFEADNENGEIFIITFESDKHLNSAPPNSVKFLLVKMSSWKCKFLSFVIIF